MNHNAANRNYQTETRRNIRRVQAWNDRKTFIYISVPETEIDWHGETGIATGIEIAPGVTIDIKTGNCGASWSAQCEPAHNDAVIVAHRTGGQ